MMSHVTLTRNAGNHRNIARDDGGFLLATSACMYSPPASTICASSRPPRDMTMGAMPRICQNANEIDGAHFGRACMQGRNHDQAR